MALHSIFDSGPERLSPEQAMRLEGIFLACRARDAAGTESGRRPRLSIKQRSGAGVSRN
jgi:hypothetical protein